MPCQSFPSCPHVSASPCRGWHCLHSPWGSNPLATVRGRGRKRFFLGRCRWDKAALRSSLPGSPIDQTWCFQASSRGCSFLPSAPERIFGHVGPLGIPTSSKALPVPLLWFLQGMVLAWCHDLFGCFVALLPLSCGIVSLIFNHLCQLIPSLLFFHRCTLTNLKKHSSSSCPEPCQMKSTSKNQVNAETIKK